MICLFRLDTGRRQVATRERFLTSASATCYMAAMRSEIVRFARAAAAATTSSNASRCHQSATQCWRISTTGTIRHPLSVGMRSMTTGASSVGSAAPRRPSPYRLIPPHTFLAEFAPLHVAGWRLDHLPDAAGAGDGGSHNGAVAEGMADLQDRRLVRLYEFELGKRGWCDIRRLVDQLGEVVEKHDVSEDRPTSRLT